MRASLPIPSTFLVLAAIGALALAGCQSGGATAVLSGVSKDAASPANEWKGPQSGPLAPFKEAQFRYRKLLEVSDGGRFLKVPYDELKDVNARDVIPVRKVRSWYVQPLPSGAESEGEYVVAGRKHLYRAIGALQGGSKLTMIYVHGRGGSRDWGFDDERFGGNFNRLKNMMLAAGGAYIAPDFTDFEADGFAEIKALVQKFRALTSGKLVVACGSMGNKHCWNLLADPASAKLLDGVIILSGFPDERFLSSAVVSASSRHVPLVIGHGSWDPYYDYKETLEMFRRLRARSPDYPVRYLLFDTGKHGAPVRMIDWRDTLNWIAAQ